MYNTTKSKTIRISQEIEDVVKAMMDAGQYDAEYKAYIALLRAGIMWRSERGEIPEVVTETADQMEQEAEPLLSSSDLHRHLTSARNGDPTLFYTIADVPMLLLYEKRADPLDPIGTALLQYHLFSKAAYLHHLFPAEALEGFDVGLLIPPKLQDAPHPLIDLLEVITPRFAFTPDQEQMIKQLLRTYTEDYDG